MRNHFLYSLLLCCFAFYSCEKDTITNAYRTKKVVIIIMDGARYNETYGALNHPYIPCLSSISKYGVVFNSFYNSGITNTVNGHTAITTGVYDTLNNGGLEFPHFPSLFHYIKRKYPTKNTWIISSKDKLEVLASTSSLDFDSTKHAHTDCGNKGLGTGFRNDSVTYNNTVAVLLNSKPDLLLINFKEPDVSGHAANWTGYLNGIRKTDEYIGKIYAFISNHPDYKDCTAFFVTNDHGRHLNGILDGFISHGDQCEGCRHIMLYASGPDFIKNKTIIKSYNLTDITATIAEIYGLKMPYSQGKIIEELFLK